ncbi:phosphoribosylanthranilate isomerase [Candidatus Koribacter versatilis Ellin345]|uniref:N-(5'-phosphoribosyl)anthranilate isomerase n=1 Tax=Koribacter versatilis (strain Ellin345) TaxID=204669 RepID=Q1ISJ0_KORVE|nr:phosphoribosylanthranilate isomerase [Candidatus Koribacter versatilis]ABF40160.1 phosphoribosylanthranilate isomerase [Candidatus Koribacter versatilis Ellin345]
MWIKVCGTTNLDDAKLAVELGANALGFIFAPSPRRVSPFEASKITAQVDPKVETIGVFINQAPSVILDTARRAGISGVQLHGEEDPGSVRNLLALALREKTPLKVYKAVHMSTIDNSFAWDAESSKMLAGMVLDSGTPIQRGGTGRTFDWNEAAPLVRVLSRRTKIIIAGGLNAQNVTRAISLFEPYGLDVVSGVESEPGKKDPAKLRAFFEAVHEAVQRR